VRDVARSRTIYSASRTASAQGRRGQRHETL